MKRLKIVQTACVLASLLMLAACTQDQLADSDVQNLPGGKYPLTFTATQDEVVASPQTRVSENDGKSSKWDGNETIGVQIGGSTETGTYTLDASGNATAQNPVYWINTQPATVNAWFPTDKTVDLSDQSGGPKYVLKGSGTGSYNSAPTLKFTHQLAKFRVMLKDDKKNLSNAKVFFYGYPTCGNNQGTATAQGDKTYIATQKVGDYYTAMLAPDNKTSDKFVKIEVNGLTYYYNPSIQLEKGKVYTYTVNGVDPYRVTDKDGNSVDNLDGIDKDITISGADVPGIKITGNCTVTMNGASISASGKPGISVIGKDVTLTLKVQGQDNSIQSTDSAGISVSGEASVTIKGNTMAPADSKLTVNAGGNTPGIGAVDGTICKNIEIKYITLDVTGGGDAAAIGTNIKKNSSTTNCNNITIKNSVVTAKGGNGAAAIGTGVGYGGNGSFGSTVGSITIEASTIHAILKPYSYVGALFYGACIGLGVRYKMGLSKCGEIRITTDDASTFMNNLQRSPNSDGRDGYKIGYGDIVWDQDFSKDDCVRSFSGVWINSEQKDTGDNKGKGYNGN